MQSMTDYILYGCGGFALEIIEYLKNHSLHLASINKYLEISDIIDASGGRYEEACNALGYRPKFHHDISSLENTDRKRMIICLGDPIVRQKQYQKLKNAGYQFGTLVHSSALIASTAKIGEGTIICPFVFVGPFARIGPNCAINVRATIGHDVTLGTSTVISPHADLNGASSCGDAVFVGAGSLLDPGKSVGSFSKIASGAVVKQTFADGFLLAGNPAKGRKLLKVPEQL